MNSPTQALDINSLDSIAAMLQPTNAQVTGPDTNGEFPSPLAGALWMATKYQALQIPLQGKVALLSEWPKKASTDPAQIQAWWDQHHCNFGTVGEPGRLFMFETDSPSVRERFQALGHDFTAGLVIESREGREHRYYPSVPGIENVAQSAVKFGDFSIRADAAYCVSPGSVHPITGKQYRVISSGGLTPPTPEEISFWRSEKKEKEKTKRDPQAAITKNRNSTLLSIGGKYIDLGEDIENVKERIREINQERCTEPLTEEELSTTVFVSLGKYAKNPDYITRKANESIPTIGGRTAEQLQAAREEQAREEEEEQAKKEQYVKDEQARRESAKNGGKSEPLGRTMRFVQGDTIQAKRLNWLWPGRILADKLNVFSGEPGVGKGMTTVDLAARLTQHLDFPDCKNELGGPKDVVFMSSEDDMEDTIVPRLIVAGADMKRIHFAQISDNSTGTLEEGIVCLDRDLPCLEEIIKQYPDIVLIIPDPIIAFLGDADANKDKDVRPIYSKMKAFAKRLNVAWLFINHWNKNQTATSINRTSGAKTMVSAPRATWMFGVSPDDPKKYLMMKGKGNLTGDSTKTLSYTIEGIPYDFHDGLPIDPKGVPKLIWGGETEDNVEDVLRDQNDPNTRHDVRAELLLTKLVKDGPVLASEVYEAGRKEKLDDNQMKRARYKLGYVAKQVVGKPWYWAKSEEDILALRQQMFTSHPVTLTPDVDLNSAVN